MPIFKIDHKEVTFIHIPKTGGTSIEDWLSDIGDIAFYSTVVPSFLKCSPQHFTYDYLSLLLGKALGQCFTIVRNPYDRAESEYFFRVGHIKPAMRPDFSTWMLNHLDHYKRNKHHLDNHMLPQSYFISQDVKVYQFESGIDQIIDLVATQFELPLPMTVPHKNRSTRASVRWSNELIDRFNRIYAADFALFDYPIKRQES